MFFCCSSLRKRSIHTYTPELTPFDPTNKCRTKFGRPSVANLLRYLFRISTVKLLIELEMHEAATEVLDILVGEDDSVALVGQRLQIGLLLFFAFFLFCLADGLGCCQVWYLLGWVHHLQEDFLLAAGYFRKMLQVYAAVGCNDSVRVGPF